MYGLPKLHKTRQPGNLPPFRPIVSSIGTYNYNLFQYLCKLLQPHVPTEYSTSDTFTFVNKQQILHMNGKL